MPESRHGRIVVELELDGTDALLGTVSLDDGDLSPFNGWIGLFAALEGSVGRVRDGAPGGMGDRTSPAEGT